MKAFHIRVEHTAARAADASALTAQANSQLATIHAPRRSRLTANLSVAISVPVTR